MKADFASDFADYLEERLGKALFSLREENEEYKNLADEYDDILRCQYQSMDEYRQALIRIADIRGKMGDIEKHYLFLAGMREHARMEDCLFSEYFEKNFTGL